MKTPALFFGLLFLTQASLPGQTMDTPKKHVLNFAYSPWSMNYLAKTNGGDKKNTTIEGDYGYKAVGSNQRYGGVFLLSYFHKPVEKIEIGINLAYEQDRMDWFIYNHPDGPYKKTEQQQYVFIMPGMTYLYVTKEFIDFYASLEIGVQYQWNNISELSGRDTHNKLNLAFQAWPAGVRIKYQSWGLFCAVGVGSIGLVKFGVSVHL